MYLFQKLKFYFDKELNPYICWFASTNLIKEKAYSKSKNLNTKVLCFCRKWSPFVRNDLCTKWSLYEVTSVLLYEVVSFVNLGHTSRSPFYEMVFVRNDCQSNWIMYQAFMDKGFIVLRCWLYFLEDDDDGGGCVS